MVLIGSYGAVYKAKIKDNKVKYEVDDVAIKIIPDADDDLSSLWKEIKFLQDLRSPYVVSFVESFLYAPKALYFELNHFSF